MALRKWTDTDLIEAVKVSTTKSDVLLRLGLEVRPGNYRTLDVYLAKLNLDTSHFIGKSHGRGGGCVGGKANKRSLSDILVKDSTYTSLKRRIVREGVLEKVCAVCGTNPEWLGKPLVLILDHINGINNDNRLENLRFLCPNCNSQQDTFCRGTYKKKLKRCSCGSILGEHAKHELCSSCRGIKQRIVERPPIDILQAQVDSLGYVGTSKLYGVSDNAIRKWLR